jgi:SAM-dependent methyltransferase
LPQKKLARAPYIIRGGMEGRDRLRIISRVMQPETLGLLQRAGIRPGIACLEVACGSGDIAFDIARMVGAQGTVVATEIDCEKLEAARREALANELTNLEFRLADAAEDEIEGSFDLIHARLILTHLRNPSRALARMRQALRPGGTIAVEDIDFRGHFSYPDSPALWRYVELYTQTAQCRGCDANIGARLPALLMEAGFEEVQMKVVQPAGISGEVKLLAALTMECIADAVVAEGLACREEIDRLVADLYEFARTPGTVGSAPRIVQAWAAHMSKA